METYALELINKNKRIDGRSFNDFRNIEMKTGVANKAEGSASVKIGNTHVIVGVKTNVGTPYADTPDQGNLIVNAEFSPIASPDFEAGPPGEDAVELARVVDRGLRESGCMELDKLCITPAEKVWTVFVDIHIINHDGNLLDCAALAAITALRNAKIPKMDGETVLRGDYEKDLPVVFKPINVTVGKVGDKLLIDPAFAEENVLETKLSVSVRDDNRVCAMQKIGAGVLSADDVGRMIDMAVAKSAELRKLVN